MNILDLPEKEITWNVLRRCAFTDFDSDYGVTVTTKPTSFLEPFFGSAVHFQSGKSYSSNLWYFLKGNRLFMGSLPRGKDEFEHTRLIDLSLCSFFTEPIFVVKPKFLSLHGKYVFHGERFFFDPIHSAAFTFHKNSETPPYEHAFTLRYPESKHHLRHDDFLGFSTKLKRRIYKLTVNR